MTGMIEAQAEITEEFRTAIERMAAAKGEGARPTFMDVLALAEAMIGSIEQLYGSVDSGIYAEFREITQHITSMKSDMAALQPKTLKLEKMPLAGQELDAIVKATEEATNTIMTSAETILGADGSDPVAYQTKVNDEIMKIFEACSFQDITGQRVTKVVETLQFIETRIDRLVATIGITEDEDWRTDEERVADARKEDQLISGPQLDGEGASQAEIDALFD